MLRQIWDLDLDRYIVFSFRYNTTEAGCRSNPENKSQPNNQMTVASFWLSAWLPFRSRFDAQINQGTHYFTTNGLFQKLDWLKFS